MARIPNSNMALNAAETSSAPVLLKERDIPEASLARRNPAGLGKTKFPFLTRASSVDKASVFVITLGGHLKELKFHFRLLRETVRVN